HADTTYHRGVGDGWIVRGAAVAEAWITVRIRIGVTVIARGIGEANSKARAAPSVAATVSTVSVSTPSVAITSAAVAVSATRGVSATEAMSASTTKTAPASARVSAAGTAPALGK